MSLRAMGNLEFIVNIGNLFKNSVILLILFIGVVHPGRNDLHFTIGTSTPAVIEGDIFFEILHPTELGYTYRLRPAFNIGPPFKKMQFKNAKLVPTIPPHSCTEILNHEEISGHIAFAERGGCTFVVKTYHAQEAGATALIVTESLTAREESLEDLIEMMDDSEKFEVDIPTGFLMGRHGTKIIKTLTKLNLNYAIINLPVNVTNIPIHKINQPPWIQW